MTNLLHGSWLAICSLSRPRNILATGFNRNHMITQEGGVIEEEYRVEYVADRTVTTAKSFMGLTMECARCHDHKYDELPKDFFNLYSFFNRLEEKGRIGYQEVASPAPKIKLNQELVDTELAFVRWPDSIPELEVMVMEEVEEVYAALIFLIAEHTFSQLPKHVEECPITF